VFSMWSRFCDASIGMDSFGYSGAGKDNFARFGIDSDGIVRKVQRYVAQIAGNTKEDIVSRACWTLLK
jgi:dihydroxyacetone synthase